MLAMYDVTNYYEAVPSNALAVLWLKPNRMRTLKVDDEESHKSAHVVKEESLNVLNQPYAFSWLDMHLLRLKLANAHNFYAIRRPRRRQLADVQAFQNVLAEQCRSTDSWRRQTRKKVFPRRKIFRRHPAPKPPFADRSNPLKPKTRNVEEKFAHSAIASVRPPAAPQPRNGRAWACLIRLCTRPRPHHRNLVSRSRLPWRRGGVDDISIHAAQCDENLYKPRDSRRNGRRIRRVIQEVQDKKSPRRTRSAENKMPVDYYAMLEGGRGATCPNTA